MRITYLLIFLSLSAFAQNKPRIQVIPNPESLEDFDHEFKGCPENSECDQVMGHMLTRWKTLVTKLKAMTDLKQQSQMLELFREKYGIPVEFYTNQKSQTGFKPVLHNSACKEHNPKTGDKILRGLAFLKSINSVKAIIWRDQAQIELPLKDNLYPQTVRVYYDSGAVSYQLPINDQPLFIKARELYVLREDDGLYYTLKISENGDWKIVNLDMTQLSTLEGKREELPCPKDEFKTSPAFGISYCKTVWNMDAGKTLVSKISQGCLI